jgi:hypothetical protein
MNSNFVKIWGEDKKKYELWYNSKVKYTCVSLSPAHEVIEELSKMFPTEVSVGVIYLIDSDGNKSIIHKTESLKRSVKKVKTYIYDSETGEEYETIKEAVEKTGNLYNHIYRQCKRKTGRTRFYYIKK